MMNYSYEIQRKLIPFSPFNVSQQANEKLKRVKISQETFAKTSRKDSDQFLKFIYTKYRDECTYWLVQKFGISKDDAIDIFQNTAIIINDKIFNQGLEIPQDKLRSYMYGVAKNKGLEYLRNLSKYVKENYARPIEKRALTFQEKEAQEVLYDRIDKGLLSLSATSKEILVLYYFKQKSISEITNLMGYKNDQTTKNMKYKSLQKLIKAVHQKLEGSE